MLAPKRRACVFSCHFRALREWRYAPLSKILSLSLANFSENFFEKMCVNARKQTIEIMKALVRFSPLSLSLQLMCESEKMGAAARAKLLIT